MANEFGSAKKHESSSGQSSAENAVTVYRDFHGDQQQSDQADDVSPENSVADTVKINASSDVVASSAATPFREQDGAVIDQYLLVKKLGQGGMGSVWKALHLKLQKHVALKLLPQEWNQNPTLLARFEREMKAVGRLEHPNIVRALDAGEAQGHHFLVMELVEGDDLSVLVKRHGPVTVAEACEFIMQAARGLASAHASGLIHRDIKPGNLMLNPQGVIKILDMGLARIQDDIAQPTDKTQDSPLTSFGQILGTPDYMAPEQWENTQAVGARTDLYALGCALFLLLVGRAPFNDEKHSTLVAKMKGHTMEVVPDLVRARRDALATQSHLKGDDIPPELNAIYQRLMARLPEDRFESGEELALSLESCLRSLSRTVPAVLGQSMLGRPVKTSTPENSASAATRPIQTESSDASTITHVNSTERASRLSRVLMVAVVVASAALIAGVIFKKPPSEPITKIAPPVEQPEPVTNPSIGWHGLPIDPPKLAVVPFGADEAQAHQKAWAEHLKVRIEIENHIGMKFRFIPPGEMAIGLGTREQPQRELKRLEQSYYLSTTEVTVGQFQKFVKATGYMAELDKFKPELTWNAPGYAVSDELPVNYVSPADAAAFCDWLSKPPEGADQEADDATRKVRYRLPTVLEWQFACAAGGEGPFGFVKEPQDLLDFAWLKENIEGKPTHVQPVGTKRANPFGLSDMLGNVWEWNQWPVAGDVGICGCGYDNPANSAFVERRYQGNWYRNENVGFRVLRELDPVTLPKSDE